MKIITLFTIKVFKSKKQIKKYKKNLIILIIKNSTTQNKHKKRLSQYVAALKVALGAILYLENNISLL